MKGLSGGRREVENGRVLLVECREVGLTVDRREENGGGLDVFVV